MLTGQKVWSRPRWRRCCGASTSLTARSRLLGPPPHSVPLCAEQAHVSFPGRLHDLISLRRAGHAQVRQLMMELDVANHGHVHRREFEKWYTRQVRNEESESGAPR